MADLDTSVTYVQHPWSAGEPITQNKMQAIEVGINVADQLAREAKNAASMNASSITSLSTIVGNFADNIDRANTTAGEAKTATEDGKRAWNQLYGVGVRYLEDGTVSKSLSTIFTERMQTVNQNIQNESTTRAEADNELASQLSIQAASISSNSVSISAVSYEVAIARNVHGNANTLAERIEDIYSNISTVDGTAQLFNTYHVGARLNALDGGTQNTKKLVPAISDEITNAFVETIPTDNGNVSTTYVSLAGRLDTMSTSITGKVSKTDIAKDLVTTDANKVLSAAQGTKLAQIIGPAYSTEYTVSSGVADALQTAKNYADAAVATANNILNSVLSSTANAEVNENEHTYVKLDDRLEDDEVKINAVKIEVEAAHRTNNDTLDDRFDDIEDELTAAKTSSTIRTEVPPTEEGQEPTYTNTTYGSLDARLEAIETYAVAAREDIDTIASELHMTDITDQIIESNSRIDTIESNVVAMAKEIGMLSDTASVVDLSTAVDRNNSEIDKINAELNDARIQVGTDTATGDPIMSTLDQRLDNIDSDITALETIISTTSTGLVDKVNTLASSVTAVEQAISHTASSDDPGGLTQRITVLETAPKSATVVIDNVTYDGQTGDPTNISNPSTDVDYLLKSGDKYYYWKYIQTGSNPDTYIWAKISGDGEGGSGSSSGAFAATLEAISEPDINIDYFVGNSEDGYLHYRFIEQQNSDQLEPVLIGVDPTNIKRYNIKRVTGKKREYDNQTQTWTTTDEDVEYLNLYEFDYGTSNAQENIEESMVPIGQVELPQGGGGGGTISTAPRVVRITPSNVVTVQSDERIYLRFFYAAVDATGESLDGTYTLKYNNNSVIDTGRLNSGAYDQAVTIGVWPADPRPIGFYQLDVTDYCRLGTQTFNLTVTTNGQNIPRAWTIDIRELRLESSAPNSQLIEVGNTIQFPYTPYGAMTKTLYVEVDGIVIATRNLGASTSGSELEIPIPSQAHGAHKISIYLKATLSEGEISTEAITRDYIWYNASDDQIDPLIIASPYRYAAISEITSWPQWVANTNYAVGDKVKITIGTTTIGYICKKANSDSTFNADNWTAQVVNAEQYEEINIPYTIYNKNAASSTVNYYAGETLIDTVTVTNSGILTYAFEEFGNKVLSIVVDTVRLDLNVVVTEIVADVAPVPNVVINFDPSTLTNNSANRLPTWEYNNETYHMTVSDNFNWANDVSGGGYKEDVDGKCFVIKAGTYAYFDYKMFTQSVDTTDPANPIYSSSVFNKGTEMKIIFKVSAVRDASAVWFTNVGNPSNENQMPIGIQLSAHQGWLKTSAADAAEKQAQLEGTTASTNSYLYFPYSEEDKIELDININRTGNREDFIMSYEDGVPSKAYAYETSEILYHEANNESIIRIGSADCDVYIYRLRIYDKGLTTNDILRNFIADGKTVAEKINRYNRNSIYYDSTKPEGQQFTPYRTGSAVLDPEKLAEKMPDVKILMLEAPTFTKDKNTFVKSKLRCIHAQGGTVYPSRGNEDNWLYTDGYHSGQGTTSDNYGQSSRNVDFLFMCDGTHTPTKKKNLPTNDYVNYVSKLIKGTTATVFNPTTKTWESAVGAEAYDCLDWKDDDTWQANTEYEVDDIVRANDLVYQCTTAHTSNVNFETTNWILLENYTNKVSLTSTSIPNNYFNLKVNVASSENVNNALFQKRYNDYLPYTSPAKQRDARTKNDMEFVPAILFIRETDTTKDENNNYVKHLEFNDTEWHFYSLGNIGDSKKTDYTRAYDPDDMNEFTVEISDNNTSNSQFQSGVYMSNGERVVETEDSVINSMNYIWDISDEEWNALRDPTEHELDHDYRVANEIKYYADGVTEVENNKYNYILPNGKVYVNYRHRTLSTEPFDGKHSFEFRYACCGDYRDGDKINDTHGKVNNVSRDDTQFDLNRAVVEAFYEWVVTASNDEFVDELSEWCVPEAVEYFYAFTHFYTMMDNRAKNCFWHFAKTGTHRQVHHTYPALLHVYDELINGEYVRTSDTEIDPQKTYYTEYAFDLWAYDMDTAAGIDNNGELIFPYGKEDGDYRQAGVSSSGYVFNGAGSIIWRRLSTSFTDQIADIFNQVNENYCFDAASLITEFDKFQNCYPEEMWRLDIERKYIRTFTGKVYDNCKLTDDGNNTKQNTRFLKEMMQGRKKYQRRQWVRDQAIYFGSKYMLNNVRNNTIEVVCYTPDAPLWNSRGYEYKENDSTLYRPFVAGDFTFYGEGSNKKLYKCIEDNTDSVFTLAHWQEGVTPDYKLKLVPYQDMYLNVAVGTGNLRTPVRAVAGQEYTIDCTANMNETRVYIYAGSYIQAISGLAPFYIGANIFSSAARLKKLDLGTDNSTYHNTNLKGLTILPNMPILEELNIKNCDSLNTPINLSESNNLKTVEAVGSMIPSLSLPAYTSIETLHLPSTVNVLTLQSARRLTDFYMINKTTSLEDYSSLINMNITDSDYSSNIDWLDIALAALPHLNILYLRDLNVATIQNITELEVFASRKSAMETQYDDYGNLINKLNLTGTINVTGSWSEVEAKKYAHTTKVQEYDAETGKYNTTQTITSAAGIWSDLTLHARGTKETKWPVTYVYGNQEKTIYVTNNDPAPDIYSTGLIDMPVKASTPEYRYIFGSRNDRTGVYIEYSGWHLHNSTTALSSAPIIQSETTLEAHFNGQKRQYYVRWLLDENRVVRTIETPIDYGSGYSEIAPTVQDIHDAHFETCSITLNSGQVTYDIFKGWDKLPTNITPDGTTDYYDIYAEWDHGQTTLVDLFTDVSNLSPAQLYVLSELNANQRTTYISNKIDEGLTMSYQLGHDYNNSVSPIVSDKTDPLYLDGTNAYNTLIQPLLNGNDAFTFAIDYCFDDVAYNSKSFATLVSCYHSANDVRNGFGIFKNVSTGCIEVGFGDIYRNSNERVAISDSLTSTTRNILVIRHIANDPYLHIYSGLDSSGSIYHTYTDNQSINGLYYTTIERNGQINFNSNAYLNIGQVIDTTKESVQNTDTVLTTVANAQGTIYWAKLWREDLGEGECRALAAWPHEHITLGLGYMRSSKDPNSIYRASQINNVPNPTLYLASLNVLEHGLISQSRVSGSTFNNNTYGWPDSVLKDILDQRLFLGLPTELQSILCKSNILYLPVNYNNYGNAGWLVERGTLLQIRGYIAAYSAANVMADNSEYESEDPNMSPLPWKDASLVQVFSYNGQSWIETSSNSQYLNIRFPGKAISFGANNDRLRIFIRPSSDISSPSNVATSIGQGRLKSGDIFIDIETPYIYVSNKEINQYGLYTNTDKANLTGLPDNIVTNIDSNNEGRGGWIKAEPYWTRSTIDGGNVYTIFSDVKLNGVVNTDNISNSTMKCKFNYILAI